jgi:hypothetical protein
MNVKRPPLAVLSLAALLMAGLALVQNTDTGLSNDVGDELARVGIEGEGDIPLPVEHG